MSITSNDSTVPLPQNGRGEAAPPFIIGLEYYQHAFAMMHAESNPTGYDISAAHSIRSRYWQLVRPSKYSGQEALALLSGYRSTIEAEMSKRIEKQSIAFYYHVYRRLFPGPVGENTKPVTVMLTRAILEAAFQRYGQPYLCNKIARSSQTPINNVLNGLLMAPEFTRERQILEQTDQLVLTDFSSVDLAACYDLEKLAYEIWRISAASRLIGKGVSLIIVDPPDCFADDRTSDLDFLVKHYDKRASRADLSVSAKGVVFPEFEQATAEGLVLFPVYNVGQVTGRDLNPLFSKAYHVSVPEEWIPNFVWMPFNLRGFRQTHIFYADNFRIKHGVPLDAVLAVVAALANRVFLLFNQIEGGWILRYYQRAYEGPNTDYSVRNEIHSLLPEACKTLDITDSSITISEIDAAIQFWTLDDTKRTTIDLVYHGPHNVFLPVGKGMVFIDYAWILHRLHNIFFGVSVEDQNFKGAALESMVRRKESALPINYCKNKAGEKRQVDYAVACGSTLLIVECKAVERSIGVERGNKESIDFRTQNVVKRALAEVDDKARWLAANQIGLNYDISAYDCILPIAVSPFVEFIPDRAPYYWLSNNVSRVLTPDELIDLIDDTSTIESASNKILLEH